MKGILFNILEDVVTEHLGEAVWDDLLEAANIEHGFTALGHYDDIEMNRLVAAAATALKQPERAVLVWAGERGVAHFARRYAEFFEPHTSARTFLPTLDEIIHPEVRKLYQGADPPDFICTWQPPRTLAVVYRSKRELCGLAEGLMRGVGEHYGDRLRIVHPQCRASGDPDCRFDLSFG